MFKVYLPAIENCCGEIQSQIRSLDNQIDEIEMVISSLSSQSNMEQIITTLRNKKERLEIQKNNYIQMMLSLKRIALEYERTENSVVSRVEESKIVVDRKTTDIIVGIVGRSVEYIKPWNV